MESTCVSLLLVLCTALLCTSSALVQQPLTEHHHSSPLVTRVGRSVNIRVVSSRHQMALHVDSKEIFNSTTGLDGETESQLLHVFVLSQHTGRLLSARSYNTTVHTKSVALEPYFVSIADGRIMVIGIKTDASLNLPTSSRRFLREQGIHSVPYLQYRNYLAVVLVVGGVTLAETVTLDEVAQLNGVFASPVILDVTAPLMPEESCSWLHQEEHQQHHNYQHQAQKYNYQQHRQHQHGQEQHHQQHQTEQYAEGPQSSRSHFCSQYAGYTELCDCSVDRPAALHWTENKLKNSAIDDVPVLIIAGNRPSSLYRCILTALSQAGGSKSRLLVSVDGHHHEVTELLDLLEINYVINEHDKPRQSLTSESLANKSGSFRISMHYLFSLENVFQKFPKAQKAIILEEDLLTSPDFFSYFSQTSWLLDADESLYCISAWNDLGALHTSRDRLSLLRVETHPGYGWMLKKEFFQDIVEEWRVLTGDHDWDVWFRSPHIRLGRECVIPEVSRTFHYGQSGMHVNELLTVAHFSGHLASAEADLKLTTEYLLQGNYESEIYRILLDDTTVFINSTMHPCYMDYFPKNFTDGPLVIFFDMLTDQDFSSWSRLGGCNGLWQMDTRGQHRGLFRFTYYNTVVFAIGHPFSDYSWSLAPGVHVIRQLLTTQERNEINALAPSNRMRFRVPDLEIFAPFLLLDKGVPRPVYIS